jgi:hypothetical protein
VLVSKEAIARNLQRANPDRPQKKRRKNNRRRRSSKKIGREKKQSKRERN